MSNKFYVITACIIVSFLYSCSKKTTPAKNTPETVSVGAGKTVVPGKIIEPGTPDSTLVNKVPVKPKPKPVVTIPKVIVVNDAGAKKSVDGRLYYDLQGRRYWRNNKDGKYYLFNKSMQNDEAFRAPAKKS